MLNELKNLLLQEINKTKPHCVNPENKQELITEYNDILEENSRLRERNSELQELLNSSMDELILAQKRYEAILQQLRNKNGGE